MKAADRARAELIKSRNLAMETARSVRHCAPNELDLTRRCIKAARDCQHDALRFARQVRP